MPPYATQSDLIDRISEVELLQIADRDNDGVIDADVVAVALTDASELIDGYISARCRMPLSTVPGIVKGWCCVLARAQLYRVDVPDYVIKDRDLALKQLRDVQEGRMVLQVDGIQPEIAAGSDQPELDDPGRDFTRDSLRAW